ncbi:MAG: hypothetical protein P9X24_04275 [Candidatus Hatepunaea meridiana]|nr:hypothetical protein [Candidatus Hatepunaea meridiana]
MPILNNRNDQNNLTNLRYSHSEISKKTKTIYKQILAEAKHFNGANFQAISASDLRRLFEMYDYHFFNRYFCNHLKNRISFRLSQRMTRSGGMTSFHKTTGDYSIVLSTTLIFQTFRDIKREVVVNGLVCRNRLEATMRIIEHEIIHLLERVLYGDSNCSRLRFGAMANDIFGHTGVTHQLVTQDERAYTKYNIRVGDNVTFDFTGKTHRGFVNRITKRATVMVPDPKGQYIDKKGNKYLKFLIPIGNLRRSK